MYIFLNTTDFVILSLSIGLYKQTHNEVIVIGITVVIAIVAIGAGVNFAVWKKYHSKLFNGTKVNLCCFLTDHEIF